MLNVVSIRQATSGPKGRDTEPEDIYAVMKAHMERARAQRMISELQRRTSRKPIFSVTVGRR